VYGNAVIRRVRALAEAGGSDYVIARKTGVSRQTVMRWRHGGFAEREDPSSSWTLAVPEYPYLLGLYLGDGCLSRPGRAKSYTLDLACDSGYTGIMREAERALREVFTINQVNTTLPSGRRAHYEYVRYFFTNYSADNRRIFCEHCDLLGIRWTQSNSRNISVSHRDSVAVLERIVGRKT